TGRTARAVEKRRIMEVAPCAGSPARHGLSDLAAGIRADEWDGIPGPSPSHARGAQWRFDGLVLNHRCGGSVGLARGAAPTSRSTPPWRGTERCANASKRGGNNQSKERQSKERFITL